MIQNSNIKTAIVAKFNNNTNLDNYEKIATEIILYKFILSFIQQNPDYANNISSVVQTYSGSFKTKFSDLKNKYNSYSVIINFLKKIDANNLLAITESNIDAVYEYYCNGKEITEFDTGSFNPEMYNIYGSIDSKTYKYLYKVHYNILCPLIKYYMKFYGKTASDMKIIDSNESNNNIGKKIEFYINGIPCSTIYADIMNSKFPFKYKEDVVLKFKYPHIEIIINF